MNKGSVKVLENLLSRYSQLLPCKEEIIKAYNILVQSFEQRGKLLVCGNGGSQADSDHIVGELMKGFMLKRPIENGFRSSLESLFDEGKYLSANLQQALPAISLGNHIALSTAFGNDIASDMVFAQQVYGYAQENDVLLCLSTSGNSINVINAVKVARAIDIKTIGISGRDGGKLKQHCDCLILIPETETFLIQELTLPVYHAICAMLEYHFFSE